MRSTILDVVLVLFVLWVWRKVCLFLDEEWRIERFQRWFPWSRLPWRRRKSRKTFWRWR
jgi:hypothetical protein